MGFVVFALMLAAIEVWAAFTTPGEVPMPEWMRLVGPVMVAASAYKYPRRDRAAVVVLGAILFLMVNRDLVGRPALAHMLVWTGCAYLGLHGIQASNRSSFTARNAIFGILVVVGTALVVLLLPLL